ncbi:TonB-dependent receptor [Croceicoccus mobilis]|uniref:TonB-dependent receptor n=1 Tax=Croceicoccus mobilis TaxID=1703339 RepID=A0A916Z769_9SPHN|nr:TonB-dependent receptor [Croceicoccus mobilis]GGD79509.1 hypothetical protein GCM10010990_31750 [Croceicoccus mobilis]
MTGIDSRLFIKALLGAGCSLASFAASINVHAQEVADESESASNGEIIVTARRREESILDVPIAVSAFNSEAIEDRGVKSINEIASFTPGLFAQTDASVSSGRNDRSSTRLTFRGLSVASGGIFINGAPYAGSGQPDLTDVSRLEVLKGPQAVYFGRSTYSGAVNYVTRDPSSTFGGSVSADIGTYGLLDVRASLEGPLIGDTLTARASIRKYKQDGQYKNFYAGGELGKEETLNANFALTFDPDPDFKLRLFYAYTRDEDGAPPTATIKNAGSGTVLDCNLGGTGGNYWCGALPDVSALPASYISLDTRMDERRIAEFVNNAGERPDTLFNPDYLDHFGFKQDIHHVSLRADYEVSGFELSAIGAYSHTKQQRLNTFTGRDVSDIANPYFTGTNEAQSSYYSFDAMQQSEYSETFFEGRVTSPQDQSIRATIGASYYGLNRPGEFVFNISPFGRGGSANAKSTIDTPAIFGGVYVDPLDGLTLTFEGRYQWDKIGSEQNYPAPADPSLTNFKRTWKSFSPRVSADYKISPDTMVYATFSRGYRQGGYNATFAGLSESDKSLIVAAAPDASEFFDQERLDNYEIGLKSAFFDRRLRTTLAIYNMNWNNGQVTSSTFAVRPDDTTVGAVLTVNRGKVRMRGVELEASFAATPNFSIDGSLQYADNKIRDYVYPDGLRINGSSDVTGNQLDQSPKWAWTLSPSYTRAISTSWDFLVRVDYIHRGKIYVDPTNSAWLDKRDTFNLHAGFENDRRGFKIQAYANNLFDDDTITAAIRGNDVVYRPSAGGVVPGVALTLNELRLGLPDKREIGVRFSQEF